MAATGTTFVCVKCQQVECDIDEFRATGGNFAKLADVQTKKLITIAGLASMLTRTDLAP